MEVMVCEEKDKEKGKERTQRRRPAELFRKAKGEKYTWYSLGFGNGG